MAGFVAIALTAKVEFVGHQVDTLAPIVNVMHARCGAAPLAPELAGIASAFVAMYTANRALWPTDYEHDFCRVTDLNTATGIQVTDTTASGTFGTESHMTDAATCALIKLLTPIRGRSFRGRIYHPISTIDINEGGKLGVTFAGNLTTAYEVLRTGLLGLTPASALTVASRKLGTSAIVLSCSCEPVVAHQRRRQLR